MPTPVEGAALTNDLLSVLARHGVSGLPATTTGVTASPVGAAGSKVAGAYITSIITGDQAFDQATLNQVTGILARGSQGGGGG